MSSALTQNGSTRAWRRRRLVILTRDHYTCQWCGRTLGDLGPRERMTVGHIKPRRHGGGDEWDNLAAQCSECQRQERPLPSHGGLHKPGGGGAYSGPARGQRLPAHNALGRPVSTYGRRATPSADTGRSVSPVAAGGTVAGQARGTSFFRETDRTDMQLSALSTHETVFMHSDQPVMHSASRVVRGDYSQRRENDGAG